MAVLLTAPLTEPALLAALALSARLMGALVLSVLPTLLVLVAASHGYCWAGPLRRRAPYPIGPGSFRGIVTNSFQPERR